MKNKTKEDIKQICTNYGEEVEAYGIGTISYALTEEQFERLFDYLDKNFVSKGELKKKLTKWVDDNDSGEEGMSCIGETQIDEFVKSLE